MGEARATSPDSGEVETSSQEVVGLQVLISCLYSNRSIEYHLDDDYGEGSKIATNILLS